MEPENLSAFYADLKSRLNSDKGVTAPNGPVTPIAGPGAPSSNMGATMPLDVALHRKMVHHCDKLKDDCRKHILLDIYVKILPCDDDFKCNHMGMMHHDIDCMLKNKGMSATQYLTSCSEATKAPLLEFIMRSTDMIGKQYMEDTTAEINADKENGIATPEVKEPSVNDADVQDQLVDIKKDPEYETFVDKLKEKTVKKIVDDVSKIIADKKDEEKMTFDTSTPANAAVAESVVGVGMDYMTNHFGKQMENIDSDELLGIAIREATLNQLDVVFRQKSGEFNEFASRIRWGKGVLINESCELFTEASKADKKKVLKFFNKLITIHAKLLSKMKSNKLSPTDIDNMMNQNKSSFKNQELKELYQLAKDAGMATIRIQDLIEQAGNWEDDDIKQMVEKFKKMVHSNPNIAKEDIETFIHMIDENF